MRKTAAQLAFKGTSGWGGKRRGAGRKNSSGTVSHGARAIVKKSTPLLVTWKIKEDLLNLRCGNVLAAFKKSAAGAKPFKLRILHYSILKDHLHLLVEADDNRSLAVGMRSLGCRFAKAIRKMIGGSGSVFKGRYHLSVLSNPTRVKNALAYVLQNQSKHFKRLMDLDGFSSAPYFGKWKELFGFKMGPILAEAGMPPPLPGYLSLPKSWLAREGWMRAIG